MKFVLTEQNILFVILRALSDRVIRDSLFARSQVSCNFYFWAILKDKMFLNNPCTEDHLKKKHSRCSIFIFHQAEFDTKLTVCVIYDACL